MKRKIKFFLIILICISSLLSISINAASFNLIDASEMNNLNQYTTNEFEYNLGSMFINGSKYDQNQESCLIDFDSRYENFDINNPRYQDGDKIIFTADWEIINDKMSGWDEGPEDNENYYPEGLHPNCLEKWEFKIYVGGNDENFVEKTTKIISDISNEEPYEELSILAPSKVVAGSEFEVIVLFHNDLPYYGWYQPINVNFNDETYLADNEYANVTLTAPDNTGSYEISAVRNWKGSWGSPVDKFTYGQTFVSVVSDLPSEQLVINIPSSALAGEQINATITAGGIPVEDVTVDIRGMTYTTNSEGIATLLVPNVNHDSELTITATKPDYTSDSKIVSIVHNPDITDESGLTGNIRLEFEINRTEFWENNPTDINVNLICKYHRWDWINHIHWAQTDRNNHWGNFDVFTTNNIPHVESFTGPTDGKVGESITFKAKASDEDSDWIQYWFDWDGDGVFLETDSTGFYEPGKEISISHKWSEAYEGPIYVGVIDKLEDQSDNIGQIDIRIVKTKTFSNPLIRKIIDVLPLLKKLFDQPIFEEILVKI